MKIVFNDDTYGNNIVFYGIDQVQDGQFMGRPGYVLLRGDCSVAFLFSYEWSLFSACPDEDYHLEPGEVEEGGFEDA